MGPEQMEIRSKRGEMQWCRRGLGGGEEKKDVKLKKVFAGRKSLVHRTSPSGANKWPNPLMER
jgi:hypothetical protein